MRLCAPRSAVILKPISILAVLALLAAALIGCDRHPEDRTVKELRAKGELVVLTRNAPTTYYLDRDQYAGPEHDMMRAFAADIGVKPRFIVYASLEALLDDLAAGKGDIAAAGLTRTEGRLQHFLVGPTYQEIRQQVVCRRGGKLAEDVADLAHLDLAVVAHSSYVARLQQLRGEHAELSWTESEADTETLLEQVWKKQIDCTIADSNIVAINRRYHPELVVTFALTAAQPLVWYMPPQAHSLQQALGKWFRRYRASGQLARTLDRYYGFAERFDYVDTRRFLRRLNTRLPAFRKWFQEAGDKYDIRWTLLAAQAYQESHWRARAKSPTGVRGIMMLTQPTAREVGVTNRLNPKQSIFGGARYLKKLRRRLPDDINEPDRTWIALAAYNVGWSHLQDAMALAAKLDKNPKNWSDLKTVLPLLSDKRYYRDLDYGYARGGEPVRYVTQIRNFEDLIVQRLASASKQTN